MRVDFIRLLLETGSLIKPQPLPKFEDIVLTVPLGYSVAHLPDRMRSDKKAVLRQVQPDNREIYGDATSWIASEACLKLDFGPGKSPGLLILGAEDPHQFAPAQGTDLLTFFATTFERIIRRWLA